MLPSNNRLPATQKLTKSNFRRSVSFSFKYSQNDLGVSRFAFVIKKAVDKRSVVRNRIRRQFRACIEEQLKNIQPGYDMLFFLEKGIIDESHEKVCKSIYESLVKEQLIIQNKVQ